MAEEDETAIAFHVKLDAVHVESLRDRCFHFAYCAAFGVVEVYKGAVLAVHNEIALGAATFGDFDEVINTQPAGPCYGND